MRKAYSKAIPTTARPICCPEKRETRECVSHQVATKALRELILKTIQTVSRYALSNEVEFARKSSGSV